MGVNSVGLQVRGQERQLNTAEIPQVDAAIYSLGLSGQSNALSKPIRNQVETVQTTLEKLKSEENHEIRNKVLKLLGAAALTAITVAAIALLATGAVVLSQNAIIFGGLGGFLLFGIGLFAYESATGMLEKSHGKSTGMLAAVWPLLFPMGAVGLAAWAFSAVPDARSNYQDSKSVAERNLNEIVEYFEQHYPRDREKLERERAEKELELAAIRANPVIREDFAKEVEHQIAERRGVLEHLAQVHTYYNRF